MADRPGILFRFDTLDALEQLALEDAGRLFLSAMRYGRDGTPPTFENPLLSVVWSFIKTAVDHDAEVYDGKILQKRFAVYVRECKRSGETPMDFDTWKSSPDITRYHPLSGDIHNQYQEHNQYQNHSHIQEQEHIQPVDGVAASPPALARDSRNLIFLDDAQYNALVADLGEQETKRCVSYLSEYCSTHNKKYHDWPTMIRKASRERWGLSASGQASAPATDFQPSADRIRENNDWLDQFLAEQEGNGGGADGS